MAELEIGQGTLALCYPWPYGIKIQGENSL